MTVSERPALRRHEPPFMDVGVVRAIVAKDLAAIRRSRAIMAPMVIVPLVLLVGLPSAVAVAARLRGSADLSGLLSRLPRDVVAPIIDRPPAEHLLTLVNGYLLLPLFLVVPLMVSAVLAADAFAGEKERRTLETLLHLPVRERDLYVAKLGVAYLPAVAISWAAFVVFCIVNDVLGWPVMGRLFLPTARWMAVMIWVSPAVAALGLGIMVRISARANTSQEANQLGGAVIMPIIIGTIGQASGLLLLSVPVILAIGTVVWLLALWLIRGGLRRFTRDRIASRL
jgi:hypothetical protein